MLATAEDRVGARSNAGLRRLASLIGTLMFAAAAPAQVQQETVLDAPQFTVDLIVFRYHDGNSAGNEVFVPDRPTLVPDAEETDQAAPAQNVFSDMPEEPLVPEPAPEAGNGEELPAERERIQLQLLEEGDQAMDEIYRKLEQLDAYEPIMRATWTQTTPPREVAPAVHLRALGEPPAGLDGSITLYLGRFLHLVVDLALDANPKSAAMTATDRLVAYGDARLRGGVEEDGYGRDEYGRTDGFEPPVRYRILEDRIMRAGDLRYFDHPRFGVVAKVTRPADSGPAADAATGR